MGKKDLLNSIRVYHFCALELNLFLDNFPDDEAATEDYCKVSAKLDGLVAEFEKNYCPLRNFGMAFFENPEKWVNGAWPWEQDYEED